MADQQRDIMPIYLQGLGLTRGGRIRCADAIQPRADCHDAYHLTLLSYRDVSRSVGTRHIYD